MLKTLSFVVALCSLLQLSAEEMHKHEGQPLSTDIFVDGCTHVSHCLQDGSIERPFSTIQAAVNHAKSLEGCNEQCPDRCQVITILIASGIYGCDRECDPENILVEIGGSTKLSLIALGPVTLGCVSGCACQPVNHPEVQDSTVGIRWLPAATSVQHGVRPTLTISSLNGITDSITPYQSYSNKFRITGDVIVDTLGEAENVVLTPLFRDTHSCDLCSSVLLNCECGGVVGFCPCGPGNCPITGGEGCNSESNVICCTVTANSPVVELNVNAEVFGGVNVSGIAMLYFYKSRIHQLVDAFDSDIVVAERTRFDKGVLIHFYGTILGCEFLSGALNNDIAIELGGVHLWDQQCVSVLLEGFFYTKIIGNLSGVGHFCTVFLLDETTCSRLEGTAFSASGACIQVPQATCTTT